MVSNARVVAEDIIGYCQLNLVEKTKSKEHIEIIKRETGRTDSAQDTNEVVERKEG